MAGRNVTIIVLGVLLTICCCCGFLFAASNGALGTALGAVAGWNLKPESISSAPVAPYNDDRPADADVGIPVQFGIFPIENGYGINAVIGSNSTGDDFVFFANGSRVYPYKTECRPFSEAAPFHGKTTVYRCDFLFSGDFQTLSVTTSYSIKIHGITLIPNAYATSNNSWAKP